MKRFRITLKGKDSTQRMTLLARDAAEARTLAQAAHQRRLERFPLTFARLEQAAATGNTGMLGIDPRRARNLDVKAWVKTETELRKRDQARYDDGDLKIASVEEVK